MKRLMLLLAVLSLSIFATSACGEDDSAFDPTSRLLDGGSTDVSKCKDGCNFLAKCTDDNFYRNECKQACDQSGFFDRDYLNCILGSTCESYVECEADYNITEE